MSTNTRKILIVDDQKELQKTLRDFFELYDWQVDEASNGDAAAEMVLSHDYDVVLSDIRMPGSTGIDLLMRLPAEVKAKVPFIIFTAYYDEKHKEQIKSLGATRVLPKPIRMSDLLAEIDRLILAKSS